MLPLIAYRAHERLAIGSQHVNRRDYHSPKRKHRGDLKSLKAIHRPTVLERAKENHDFPCKVREAGQADRSEDSDAKSEPGEGHHFGETAKFIENQCARPLT